jgi:plasmid stabilization system protein ParE
MKSVRFLLPAELEMVDGAEYYESQAAKLGANFLAAVELAITDIAAHPDRWPVVRGAIRRRLVRRFPYGVLYRDDPDEIVVLAVMHLRRHPGYWHHRL